MKLTPKIVFVVVFVIGGLTETRCRSADLGVDRSTSNGSGSSGGNGSGCDGPVRRLARMLYHNVCTDRKQPEFYHPKPSGIDAFRSRCGLSKLHDSFLDSNAFECAGGHRALPDDTGDNSIQGQQHSGLHLARKRMMAGSLKVRPEEAPHSVQIVGISWNGRPFKQRGGTIIHKNLVLTAAPVCLRLQSAPRNDAICFAAGRGAVNRNQKFSPYLGGMPMEMDPSSYDLPANETFRWTPLIEATVCRGDSGSGLVCYDSCNDSGVVRAHLVGVAITVEPKTFVCEERKQRGGYVNLHGLRDRVRAMLFTILK